MQSIALYRPGYVTPNKDLEPRAPGCGRSRRQPCMGVSASVPFLCVAGVAVKEGFGLKVSEVAQILKMSKTISKIVHGGPRGRACGRVHRPTLHPSRHELIGYRPHAADDTDSGNLVAMMHDFADTSGIAMEIHGARADDRRHDRREADDRAVRISRRDSAAITRSSASKWKPSPIPWHADIVNVITKASSRARQYLRVRNAYAARTRPVKRARVMLAALPVRTRRIRQAVPARK